MQVGRAELLLSGEGLVRSSAVQRDIGWGAATLIAVCDWARVHIVLALEGIGLLGGLFHD